MEKHKVETVKFGSFVAIFDFEFIPKADDPILLKEGDIIPHIKKLVEVKLVFHSRRNVAVVVDLDAHQFDIMIETVQKTQGDIIEMEYHDLPF
jgi:hypothetical protein